MLSILSIALKRSLKYLLLVLCVSTVTLRMINLKISGGRLEDFYYSQVTAFFYVIIHVHAVMYYRCWRGVIKWDTSSD